MGLGTSPGRMMRARLIAGSGIGHRYRRQQRFGVRMLRMGEQRAARRELDDAAEIHHRDAVADVLDDREVVRDEEIRQAELRLQVHEQVDDLRLHRHVQRRDGLVADDHLGLDGEGARDPQALALSAGKLVRVLAHLIGPQADAREQPRHALGALCRPTRCRSCASGSPTISPALMRGLSDAYGS